jgi:hypothetical protein
MIKECAFKLKEYCSGTSQKAKAVKEGKAKPPVLQ